MSDGGRGGIVGAGVPRDRDAGRVALRPGWLCIRQGLGGHDGGGRARDTRRPGMRDTTDGAAWHGHAGAVNEGANPNRRAGSGYRQE